MKVAHMTLLLPFLLAGLGEARSEEGKADQEKKDLRMKAELDAIRLRQGFDAAARVQTAKALHLAFADYGIDVSKLDAKEAATRVKASAIRDALTTALDDWAVFAAKDDRKYLEDVLLLADPDRFRIRVREAIAKCNRDTLVKLATHDSVRDLSPALLVQMGVALAYTGASVEAIALLKQAQQRHPGDLWINYQLAYLLDTARPPKTDDAIRFYKAAVALRPTRADMHLYLGNALRRKGNFDEAIGAIGKAIELDPKLPGAFDALGHVFREQGKLDAAIACYQKALEIDPPGQAASRVGMADALARKGKTDEAIATLKEAIRLKPDLAVAYLNLGMLLTQMGKYPDAVAAFRQAIRLRPDHAQSHMNLGIALGFQGKLQEAIAACGEAVRLDPNSVEAHLNLGVMLQQAGKVEEAVASCRKAIRLKPDDAEPHVGLGVALKAQGKFVEAIAAHREAIRLKPDFPYAYHNLGLVLKEQGMNKEAVAALKRALELMSEKDPTRPRTQEMLRACEKALNKDGK
jgi:tetratricopeptide (TPR) repeat protein